jgi:hypothetical protein
MPENVVWFFRGAKTQKGHFPRRCGETSCGLNVLLQDQDGFAKDASIDAHTLDFTNASNKVKNATCEFRLPTDT